MTKRYVIGLVVFASAVVASNVEAGSISGVVQQLDGKKLADVTITVRDLATGRTVGLVATSDASGNFTVSLPNGRAVSVTFSNDGANLDATLVGISGSVNLKAFDIFMPQRKQRPCVSYYYSPTRCRPRYSRCW